MLATVADDFSALFSDHFARWGRTQTEFADAVGTTQPTVALVMQGKRTPRPAALNRWADVLGLIGEEREHFIEAGNSARATSHKAIAPYVQQLEDELEEAHRNNGRLHADLAALNQHLAKLGSQATQLAGIVVAHGQSLPKEALRLALEVLERVEPKA